MNEKQVHDVTIDEISRKYKCSHVNNDMLLLDEIASMPMNNYPKRLDPIMVGLCLKGNACYTVNTEEHKVQPADVIIISNGQVVDNYQYSPDFSGIAILMTEAFFQEIIKGVHELSQLFLLSRIRPVCHIDEKEVEAIKTYFKLIRQKVDDVDNHFRKDVVCTLMRAMIYDLGDQLFKRQHNDNRKETRTESLFTRFIELVEKHFRTERRVSWYAGELNISSKYLSEAVKQVSNRTPTEWIDNYVTLEMRVLLKNSDKSVKEIANLLGFANQSFLGKFFKKHVGMSPTQYRRQ